MTDNKKFWKYICILWDIKLYLAIVCLTLDMKKKEWFKTVFFLNHVGVKDI